VLLGYPVLWLAPVLVWAFMTPGATTQLCRNSWLSAHPPEGTCLTLSPVDSHQKVLLTAVDPGHTLHWGDRDAELRALRVRRGRRPPALDVAAVKLSLTNTGSRPAVFDSSTVLTVLNIPSATHAVRTMRSLPGRVHVRGFPSLESSEPIQPGATRTAWQR